MNTFLIIVHVIVSAVLIIVILLQAGKGSGLGGAFGGSSQAVFGGRGAQTFLGKVTSASAAVFMVTSLSLSYLSTRSGSVVKEAPGPSAPAPVAPAMPGPAQGPGSRVLETAPAPGGAPAAPGQPVQAPPKW
ncbi:MAG: preprotein translocase subunit SecG [Deltaproteobacteria bacterium]